MLLTTILLTSVLIQVRAVPAEPAPDTVVPDMAALLASGELFPMNRTDGLDAGSFDSRSLSFPFALNARYRYCETGYSMCRNTFCVQNGDGCCPNDDYGCPIGGRCCGSRKCCNPGSRCCHGGGISCTREDYWCCPTGGGCPPNSYCCNDGLHCSWTSTGCSGTSGSSGGGGSGTSGGQEGGGNKENTYTPPTTTRTTSTPTSTTSTSSTSYKWIETYTANPTVYFPTAATRWTPPTATGSRTVTAGAEPSRTVNLDTEIEYTGEWREMSSCDPANKAKVLVATGNMTITLSTDVAGFSLSCQESKYFELYNSKGERIYWSSGSGNNGTVDGKGVPGHTCAVTHAFDLLATGRAGYEIGYTITLIFTTYYDEAAGLQRRGLEFFKLNQMTVYRRRADIPVGARGGNVDAAAVGSNGTTTIRAATTDVAAPTFTRPNIIAGSRRTANTAWPTLAAIVIAAAYAMW